MQNKKKKGFTLIELLVVIAIIGLLASIVLVSVNSARVKARDTKRIADLKQIQLALEMHYETNNSYGGTNGLGDVETTECTPLPSSLSNLSSVPTDPKDGSAYQYGWGGATDENYILVATLENSDNNPLTATSSPTIGGCQATAPGQYWVASK